MGVFADGVQTIRGLRLQDMLLTESRIVRSAKSCDRYKHPLWGKIVNKELSAIRSPEQVIRMEGWRR
jgi:hypothetical protein